MAIDPSEFPKVLMLYLELSQYPILANSIRERMREEIFKRGVISREAFEAEVREKAIQSQAREGLLDPMVEEAPDTWSTRIQIIRDNLTDFYFAYNLPHDLFEDLVRETLADRVPSKDVVLTFHPELAPWDMLFAQGESYEALPQEKRQQVEHHLEEIKVVLIKAMISDHLEYIGIAKKWFSISDVKAVRSRRLGRGKIGGKAAGIVLAECILRKKADDLLIDRLHVPRSWFLGADVFYQFTHFNQLIDFANQKYRDEAGIRDEQPAIRERFSEGRFPEDIVEGLRGILEQVGDTPLIVRSSSLLEDSFGYSFAGKYESHFCPNQGSPSENLGILIRAISNVYASVYSPDVLLYRRSKGLLDYDERMGILIQEVQGHRVGRYFMPDAAGVAFSRNQYRWSPRIDRAAGFLRLVWGLGTRAVEHLGGDYPRLVALSHPNLKPEDDPERIRRNSQHMVDVIDIEANAFRTLPIIDVIGRETPFLRYLAQRYDAGGLHDFLSLPPNLDPKQVVLTFDGLLCKTDFSGQMRQMLSTLETAYRAPVDVEFLVMLDQEEHGQPEPHLSLLQCRPQSHLSGAAVRFPADVPEEKLVFFSRGMVPDGQVEAIRYLVFVPLEGYRQLDGHKRVELARLIGRINSALANETFILLGPGRWGSDNPELGIPVTYADIYHARALVEVVADENAPDPSYGTHFFQDLVEAQIYTFALALEDPESTFNQKIFDSARNVLEVLLPKDAAWGTNVKLIDLLATSNGQTMDLVMDGDDGRVMGYLTKVRHKPVRAR